MDPDTSRAVYEIYRPLDNGGSTVDPPLEPLRSVPMCVYICVCGPEVHTDHQILSGNHHIPSGNTQLHVCHY